MNLTELLQAIADAIRTKKGTTETINAQDFPTEIANLPLVVASCAISGENKVGSTLTCSTGNITSVSYQWYRGNNAISNATGKTYTLTGSDVGNAIKCKATMYGKTVDSNTITVLTPTCSISGGTTVGNTMTCSVGNTNASVSYQWYRGNNAISNATGRTYTLTNSDVGNTIKCKVTTSGYGIWSNISDTVYALVTEYFSFDTYHKGGGSSFSAEDTKDVGKLVQVLSSTLTSNNNKGNSPTYVLYGRATTSDSWEELGRTSHGGGTFTINVTSKKYYQYFKIYQSTSQWRRDDGNEVCSIEPWRVDYQYKKYSN